MSAGCLRWVLSHAVRAACAGGSPGYRTPASRFLICSERSNNTALSWRWSLFSTAVDDSEHNPPPKKKKQDPRARATINSVGRKIPQRLLQVISETGENMGTMHRGDVIRIMDEQGLKLVILNEHKDPPVYRLMSGKQIHEEQLRLREKQKAKAGPVQVKELTFSSDIATHDLTTKLRQVQSWLDKKHHVRITLRSGRGETTGALELNQWTYRGENVIEHLVSVWDLTLEQMVQQIEVMVGFVSKPKVIRDGQAAMCVLRPPSAKELSQKGQNKASAAQSSESSSQPSTAPISPVHTTQGPVQE